MKIKEIVVLSSVMSLLGTVTIPTAQVFASQNQSETSFQDNAGYLLDENNQHFMIVIDTIRNNGNNALADDLYSFFNGKTVTSENRDQLIHEFEDFYNRRPQTRAAMSTVLATIAAAMAVTKGMYEAGYYAAKQLHTREILTKEQYKPNGGWWMAGIAVAFGVPASLGFDDYMYNR